MDNNYRKVRLAVQWQVGSSREGKAHRDVKQRCSARWVTFTALGAMFIVLYIWIGVDDVVARAQHSSTQILLQGRGGGGDVGPLPEPTRAYETTAMTPASSSEPDTADVQSQIATTQPAAAADDQCAGRRIFVYDLPPQFNKLLVEDCANLMTWWDMCEDVSNGGLGAMMDLPAADSMARVLLPRGAWYRTDQFNLEVIFHERVKAYPCLTTDPTQASMFYIPFYPALDLTRHLHSPAMNLRDRLSQSLIGWLEARPEWQRHQGRRHVLVLGRIVWDFLRKEDAESGWGNALLSLPELRNVTKLAIERKIWSRDMMAVPYPTAFHPSVDADIRAWQSAARRAKRDLFASFAGSSRNRDMAGTVRGEVFRQCANSSSRCTLLACTHERCVRNPQTITALALRSVFCLQPPGDSPTRKGIFDTLIAGCIPVLFDPESAAEQYRWHLPGDTAAYSVTIPGADVVRGDVDVMHHLACIPAAAVKKMHHAIVEMLPRLIYRKPGVARDAVASQDAFDVSIARLLEKFEIDDEASRRPD